MLQELCSSKSTLMRNSLDVRINIFRRQMVQFHYGEFQSFRREIEWKSNRADGIIGRSSWLVARWARWQALRAIH
jgi:hypothetical protein